MPLALRELSPTDIPACAEILSALPDWFGLEESNRAYVEALSRLPGAVVTDVANDRVVGFVAVEDHTPRSSEIHVIAVRPEHHRSGAGRRLMRWAEDRARAAHAPWLHVKTRGPATPDPDYAKTRAFYRALGYEPLFETLELWGPENAALILLKHLPERGAS